MIKIIATITGFIIWAISVIYIIRGAIQANSIVSKYQARFSDLFSTKKRLPEEYYKEIDKANRIIIKGFLIFIIGGLSISGIMQLIKHLNL